MPIGPTSQPASLEPADRRSIPGLSKLGAVVIAFGLLFDLVEHDLSHVGEPRIGAFPVAEHLAHLVVLVGMVLVLVGIVADGIRQERRRRRPEGVSRHALR
jgi:hypothetical protein